MNTVKCVLQFNGRDSSERFFHLRFVGDEETVVEMVFLGLGI